MQVIYYDFGQVSFLFYQMLFSSFYDNVLWQKQVKEMACFHLQFKLDSIMSRK